MSKIDFNTMYTDEYETDKDFDMPTSDNNVNIKQLGIVKKITIDNKTFDVIEPTFIKNIESLTRSLSNKILSLEQELQNLRSRLSNQEKMLRDVRKELDNKVNYE